MHYTMIIIFIRDCNQISQSFYNSVTDKIQFYLMTNSCSRYTFLTVFGYYRWTVKLSSESVQLRIFQVICSKCETSYVNRRQILQKPSITYLLAPCQSDITIKLGKSCVYYPILWYTASFFLT